ncbi:hypothetical protein KEM55_001877 [Ascosphaera atra]|nr:hypothetical protein KEM55_001877 [Ascosphaera atra]
MSHVLSFIVFLVIVAVIAAVLWVVWEVYMSVIGETRQKLAGKDINFSRAGASIGVRTEDEAYQDKTQRYMYRAWNNSSGAALTNGRGASWLSRPRNA